MPRVTITVPEKTPQPYRFQLDRKSVTLGRGSENDIPIDCGSVSVKHAEMRRTQGGYELRDLGSTNGIKENGERREVIRLRNGLPVTLGDVAFDFLLTDEELETLAAEKPAAGSPMELPPLEEVEDLPGNPETPKPKQEPKHELEPEEKSASVGMILLFILLAAAAFAAGVALRFQKDTGESLIDAMKAKSPPAAVSPAAAPDGPTQPGE